MDGKNPQSAVVHSKTSNGSPQLDDNQDGGFLPGTKLIVDFDGHISAAHAANKEILLIPQPTSDSDDPLNWGKGRKCLAMGVVVLYTTLLGAATISPGVTYSALIPQFYPVTINYLNTGAALAVLFLGLGNLILNPLVTLPLHSHTEVKVTYARHSNMAVVQSTSSPRSLPAFRKSFAQLLIPRPFSLVAASFSGLPLLRSSNFLPSVLTTNSLSTSVVWESPFTFMG